jgi:hypothetical protein
LYFIKTKEFAFGTGYLIDKLDGNFSLGAWVLPIIFVALKDNSPWYIYSPDKHLEVQ